MRPTREMIVISDLIRENDSWRECFLSRSNDELKKLVLDGGDPALGPVRKRIEKFLEEYGCRCMDELKLEEPTLREDPSFLFTTLCAYVKKRPAGIDAQIESQLAVRIKAEKSVLGRVGVLERIRLRRAIERVRRHVYYREELRLVRGKYWGIVRRIFWAIGRNLEQEKILRAWNDIFLLKVDEVAEIIEGRSPDLGHVQELIELRRRAQVEHLARADGARRIYSFGDVCGMNFVYDFGHSKSGGSGSDQAADGVMRGIACGPGIAKGRAKVIHSASAATGLDGEILVTERTDPGWIPLYPFISGLVIERGSVLSHSAVVAREMGIPTVVGVAGATRMIKTDDQVMVDGGAGTVQILPE